MALAAQRHLALIHHLVEEVGNISIVLPEAIPATANAGREQYVNIGQLLSEFDHAILTEVILGGDVN